MTARRSHRRSSAQLYRFNNSPTSRKARPMIAPASSDLAKSFETWMTKPTSKGPDLLATSAEGVAAGAMLAGPGATAGLAASKALAAKAKSDPTGAKAEFKDRPMDGCTTLMNMARVKAGFDPTERMSGANIAAYQ